MQLAYDAAVAALQDALGPVVAYVARVFDTADASNPADAGKLRHACQLDALVNAVIDYGAAADAEAGRTPCPPAVLALLARVRGLPAFTAAMERPKATRALAGSITSYCLPVPLAFQPYGQPVRELPQQPHAPAGPAQRRAA